MNCYNLLFLLLLVFSAAPVLNAEDLSRIGIDARGQALGRAVSAISGDFNAPFVNAAGMSAVQSLSLSSMYMKYYEDVSYIVAGGAMPLFGGTAGLRCVSIRVDDIIKTMRQTDPDKIKPFNPDFPDLSRIEAAGSFSYFSNIYALSYANNFTKHLALGVTAKIFHNRMDTISSGNALGLDMDFGALYRFDDLPLSISLVFRNVLPGPNLYWATGTQESIPINVLAGFAYSPISTLLLTGEMLYDRSSDGLLLYRAGAEWHPVHLIALRAGCYEVHDKPWIKMTNFTVGAGIELSGIKFDYAFKPDLDLNYNHLHFFSLGIAFH